MTALDRSAVEAILSAAEAAHAKAVVELATAREQLAHAEAKHDETRTVASRKAVSDAGIDVESSERAEKRRAKELEGARSNMRTLVREEQTEALAIAKEKLGQLPVQLQTHASRLIELDRQVADSVLAVVRDVAAGIQTFDQAKALAPELGESVRFEREFQRPTVANARLEVARAVTSARLADTPVRHPVAPAWLEHVPGALHWKVADADAGELADASAFAAREAERSRRTDLATAHAVVALQGAAAGAIPATSPTPANGA